MGTSIFRPPSSTRDRPGWHIRRLASLGSFFQARGGSKEDDVDAGVPCIRYGDLYTTYDIHIQRVRRHVPPEVARGYTPLQSGDIVMASSGEAIADIGKCAVLLGQQTVVCGGDIVVLRPSFGVNPRFLAYALNAEPHRKQISRRSSGTMIIHTSVGKLKDVRISLPSAEEQAAIVKYLVHADARINKAIAAKCRLRHLLQEQKHALSRTFVRQAASEAPSRVPSGLAWLGEVPSEWVEHRAKAILRDVDERSTSGLEEVLSVSHLTGVTPRSEKQITMFEAASYVGHKLCQPDDLVVNTMWAWMAALGVSRHHGLVSPAYNVYRPRREGVVATEFLAHLLRSQPYNDMFRMYSTGIRPSRLRFYPDQMLATPIFLPPAEEQRRIVRRLADGTAETDGAISRVEDEMDLLRELRHRLIADAVTGQIDVRDMAASLAGTDNTEAWGEAEFSRDFEPADFNGVLEASEGT